MEGKVLGTFEFLQHYLETPEKLMNYNKYCLVSMLCSLIGAATIAVGFYSAMWGKSNEVMNIEDSGIPGLDSSTDNVPLLQNKSMDV